MGGKRERPGFQIVQGPAQWKALGFRNERAFQRARQGGWSEVPVYPVTGQSRGVYARLDELNAYLERKAAAAGGEGGPVR